MNTTHPNKALYLSAEHDLTISVVIKGCHNRQVTWFSDAGDNILIFRENTTNSQGEAVNEIIPSAVKSERTTIFIRSSDGSRYIAGVLYKVSGTPVFCFIPWGKESPDLPSQSSGPQQHVSHAEDTLQLNVIYPAKGDLLKVSCPQTVWVRCTSDGVNGVAGLPLIADLDGEFELYPDNESNLVFTDGNGWATLSVITKEKINQKNIGPNDMSPAHDATGVITVTVKDTGVSTQSSLYASPKAGGPGILSYVIGPQDVGRDVQANDKKFLTLSYRYCDGSPVQYRSMNIHFPFCGDFETRTNGKGEAYVTFSANKVKESVFYVSSFNTLDERHPWDCIETFSCIFREPSDYPEVFSGYISVDPVHLHHDDGELSINVKYIPYNEEDDVSGVHMTMVSLPDELTLTSPFNDVSVDPSGNATFTFTVDNAGLLTPEPCVNTLFSCCASSDRFYNIYATADGLFENEAASSEWKKRNHIITHLEPEGSTQLQAGVPTTIHIKVCNAFDAGGIQDTCIHLYCPQSQVNIDPPVVKTNSFGEAVFTVTSPFITGVDTISVYSSESNHINGLSSTASCTLHAPKSVPVVVSSHDELPLALNTQHVLTALCTLSDGKPAAGMPVWWSAQPEGIVTFSDASPLSDNTGSASVNICAFGSVADIPPVTVYAGFNDESANEMESGHLDIAWRTGEPVPTGKAVLSLISVDGPVLAADGIYLLKATYRDAVTGTPLSGRSVTWAPTRAHGMILESDVTVTDEEGVTTNMLWGALRPLTETNIVFTVTTLNQTTSLPDSASLPVLFVPVPVPVPGAGHMRIYDDVGSSEMVLGKTYTLTAVYTRADGVHPAGQKIYWAAYPSEHIHLSEDASFTDGTGTATTTMFATGDKQIEGARIVASTANALTGGNDAAGLDVMFLPYKAPAWNGIGINKGYAINPKVGLPSNPNDPAQVIRLNITTPQGEQMITLSTEPVSPSVTMYNAAQEPLLEQGNTFSLTSRKDGSAVVLVAAQSVSAFNIIANTGSELKVKTALVMASITSSFATLPAPVISGNGVSIMNGNVLVAIPDAQEQNSTTFQMKVTADGVKANDVIAAILNGRLAWEGNGEQLNNRELNIAYAMLKAGANQLAYIVNGDESRILNINVTSGNAQTSPKTQVSRSLAAVVPEWPLLEVYAPAIVDGFTVTVTPGVPLQAEDIISTFFYLKGKYLPDGKAMNNIIQVDHILQQEDDVLRTGTLMVTLAQGLIAGITGLSTDTTGSLQVDYSLTRRGEALSWSDILSLSLNT